MKDLKFGILNDLYGGILTEKQHDMLRSYYDFDLSLSEIAEEYGISRQAAFDALKKGEHTLTECEKALGFMAKTSDIEAKLDDIVSAIDGGDSARAREIALDALKIIQ